MIINLASQRFASKYTAPKERKLYTMPHSIIIIGLAKKQNIGIVKLIQEILLKQRCSYKEIPSLELYQPDGILKKIDGLFKSRLLGIMQEILKWNQLRMVTKRSSNKTKDGSNKQPSYVLCAKTNQNFASFQLW